MNHGTSIYAIITKQGIVIGADSKAALTNFGTPPDGFLKLVSIHKRVVVACEGMCAFTGYCFHEWVTAIESKLSPDLEADALARAIEREISEPFRQAFRKIKGAAHQMLNYSARKGHLASFFIAYGFTLRQIIVSVDEPKRAITANTEVKSDREPRELTPKGYGAGRFKEIEKAIYERNSDAHKNILALHPVGFKRLLNGQELSQEELGTIMRSLIQIQAKADPEHVGPPFRIATIYPGQTIRVTN